MGIYILVMAFVCVGGLFAYLGYSQMKSNKEKFANWLRIEGTVVELVGLYGGSHGRTLYAPRYRYTVQGVECTAVSDTAAAPPAYAVGDTVRVLVNPQKTSQATIIDSSTAVFSYGMLAMGVVTIALGLLFGWLANASGKQ